MYSLSTPLQSITGVGPAIAEKFSSKKIFNVKDLLLFLPLRYEDRSEFFTIKQIQEDNSPENSKDFKNIKAKVNSSNNFYKGRRSIQSATVSDETGKLKLMWFNNPWVIKKLEKNKNYIFSGKINDKGVMMQAIVDTNNSDNIHSGRLVPVYSSLENIKQGNLRRILKRITDNLVAIDLRSTLTQLHFPETKEAVILARERLALEEILTLIKQSEQSKKQWQKQSNAVAVKTHRDASLQIPKSIPFKLTKAQEKANKEILFDISKTTPMNRLLIGDVGSGKTVVAGIACHHIIKTGHSACLIAPTQILAQQHVETFKKLFPDLEINLVTGKTRQPSVKQPSVEKPSVEKPSVEKPSVEKPSVEKPSVETRLIASLHIGTHALINKLDKIKPALIIYDEQHRFGVSQRSGSVENETRHSVPLQNQMQPHVLTMSATPIPRSLMLTIFSHLSLSVIDEMPPNRKPVKTWLVPQNKRADAYKWVYKTLSNKLAIVVTPFISESKIPGFEHIASAESIYKELVETRYSVSQKLNIALLHGKLNLKEKEKITQDLFKQKIDILVTTPVIEVGLDLPSANIVVIESAQRFGLASLHQLRGRVGRAGQESYCLVIPSASAETRHSMSQNNNQPSQRLKEFTKENSGMKLAEKDLKRRGAGNLFGTQQSGFDQLKFASWTNFELLAKARQTYEKIEKGELKWDYFFKADKLSESKTPAAN